MSRNDNLSKLTEFVSDNIHDKAPEAEEIWNALPPRNQRRVLMEFIIEQTLPPPN